MSKKWEEMSVEARQTYIGRVRMASTVIKSLVPADMKEKVQEAFDVESAALDFLASSLVGTAPTEAN